MTTTIVMKDGSVWLATGGSETEDYYAEDSPIVAYWCTEYSDSHLYDPEMDSNTKFSIDDPNILHIFPHECFIEGLIMHFVNGAFTTEGAYELNHQKEGYVFGVIFGMNDFEVATEVLTVIHKRLHPKFDLINWEEKMCDDLLTYSFLAVRNEGTDLLNLVEVKPKLEDFFSMDDENSKYYHHSDTQQILYVVNGKYFVQAASVLYLAYYESIQEVKND
jgi:hypothetical protein